MNIQLIRADITSMKVDAMVSPATSDEEAAPVGHQLTKFIIHAVVPAFGSNDAEQRLRRSTERALERAEELAVASVAMPAMWTAPAEAVERCARIMIETTISYGPRARSLQRVVYCLFGEGVYETFERVLRETRQA